MLITDKCLHDDFVSIDLEIAGLEKELTIPSKNHRNRFLNFPGREYLVHTESLGFVD